MNHMIYEMNHTLNCGYEIKKSYDPQMTSAPTSVASEVTGSNPVEVLNFLGFSTQLLKLRP